MAERMPVLRCPRLVGIGAVIRATAFFRWLWSPITALWFEIIGLRSEQIRSLAVVAGLVILFRGFERMDAGDSLVAPFVVVTIICLAMTFGLAWQATSIKGQWGAAAISLGRDPDPDNRVTTQSTAVLTALVPDDDDRDQDGGQHDQP